MPLSWNEIRSRALAFSREWSGTASERAEAQTFWNRFFEVFGIDRKRVAVFEKQVQLSRVGERLKSGRIDLFWKGMLLVEHKSEGQDLDKAFGQAADYFQAIEDRDLPRYILVSDFARFRLHDLEAGTEIEFALADLHKNIRRFGFLAGYRVQEIKPQDPVNIKAAVQMGKLHDRLKAAGYTGHALEVLLVRVLFCLFADDTGIFPPARSFRTWIEERTSPDGSDLGPQLGLLFQVLNKQEHARPKTLDEQVAAFPYVNGKLFEETLEIASFDAKMRATLLDCCALDWGAISPAIFGALFQSIMDEKARRNLGAHYTSEENILKVIKPLFLDDLWAEFAKVKSHKVRLLEFHAKLRSLTFMDPACGCGNFLVITYRELRKLELEVLRQSLEAEMRTGQKVVDVAPLIAVDVDQFYGIEIEEFPAQIAQVAMWLVDHQMNQRVSEEFGMYFARIPLKSTPHITHGNALRIEWGDVLPSAKCSYVLGNPPFVGAMIMSEPQREDVAAVFSDLKGYGVLDFVSAWYWKAARYIQGSEIRVGLVSTNSITQGEQVGILWAPLMTRFGIRIHFAHRTFRWSNEAKGVAAVHCVIIGFGPSEPARRTIFEYDDISGDPHATEAANINAYLIDAPDVFLVNRDVPIDNVPAMRFGSMPRDGGHLVLEEGARAALVGAEPGAAKWIRQYVGAQEFLNGEKRYCLWLVGASPAELRALPLVMARVAAVREFRLKSKAAPTRKFASTPTLFCQIAQPSSEYLIVPGVSSERRVYVPVGFLSPGVVASNLVFVVPDATPFHLGVVSSKMHMAWMRFTCGRLKSDFRYSKDIVYNNFPWPLDATDAQRQGIEDLAADVLASRARYPDSTLADLYDPLAMPPDLLKAHEKLDAAVDAAYGRRTFRNDAERLAFLFEEYRRKTSLLPVERKSAPKRRRAVHDAGGDQLR